MCALVHESPLHVRDTTGRERYGRLLVAERWHEELGRASADEEFRIVVLLEPCDDVRPTGPVAVCVPAPGGPGRAAEPPATYAAEGEVGLDARTLERLARGRVAAGLALGIAPRQVFGARGPRWQRLARHLVHRHQRQLMLEAAARALWAPQEPPAAAAETGSRLREVAARARAALPPGAPAALADSLARVEAWLAARGPVAEVRAWRRFREGPVSLAGDIWAVRALAERPQEALEVARMRCFLSRAASADPELELDRALAREQLGYAALVLEPQRLATARAAFSSFQRRYRQAYDSHHRSYWRDARALQERLLEAAPRVRALRLLASLLELGPPVGMKAAAGWEELCGRLSPCPSDVPSLTDERDVRCRLCHLPPDAQLPRREAEECLNRVDRALSRQTSRLARALVADVLSAGSEPAAERLLKAVQASQVASLPEVLDEALIGQVRRFLAEAAVRRALAPVLEALQRGRSPGRDEISHAMARARRALERSARALGAS